MIPADTIRAFGNELSKIIKHAELTRTASALGKITSSGKVRAMQLPRVNLPVPKVV